MRVIIDPAWSLLRAVEGAREAYVGSGKSSRGYRLSVLMAWGNVVGWRRAQDQFREVLLAAGNQRRFAEELELTLWALRKLANHFARLPKHRVTSDTDDSGLASLRQLKFIGRGGYGEVWSAIDALDRRVAIKFILAGSDVAASSVLAHAAPLAAIGQHPNVVSVFYCSGVAHPQTGMVAPAMVMEFIEGRSLGEALREFMPLTTAIEIGDAVAAGVQFVHSKGLFHGDLHADNVMLPSVGGAKLIDLMNEKRLSQIASGSRRLASTDDVEALKALVSDLLRKNPRAALANQFDVLAQQHVTAAGVRSALASLVVRDESQQRIGTFLLIWGELERAVRSLRGERQRPVSSIVAEMNLSRDARSEFEELRQIRNLVAHGELTDLSEDALARLRILARDVNASADVALLRGNR